MAFLSDSDRRRIEEAVARGEARTAAEFVTVIAQESAQYFELPTLIAACLVLILSGLALLLPVDYSTVEFYAAQVTAFILLTILFRLPALKMRMIPAALKARRAHLLAHEQFLDLGLSSTRRQTGVMLFVSVAERYVEIIADAGVQADVDDRLWQGIIDRFVDKVRTGSFAEGFADAIDACTAEIAKHHPRTADDVNELPNRLVEL